LKKVSRLITHGCSFTYGEELQDPSVSSWPSLLANQLDVELVNLAKPAYSNDAILQDLVAQDINQIPTDHPPGWENYTDLVIICWTSNLRMRFEDDQGHYTVMAKSKEQGHRKQISDLLMATTDTKWLYERWLTQVILAQLYLDSRHAKYIFFNAFDNQATFKDLRTPLKAKIDASRFLGWPYEGFVEWAYPCELGPRGHPLERGHAKVADKLLAALDERYDIR
jgi:hypothetical protein